MVNLRIGLVLLVCNLQSYCAATDQVFQGSCNLSYDVTCDHVCVDQLDGTHVCRCRTGYELADDGAQCQHVNSTTRIVGLTHQRKLQADQLAFEKIKKSSSKLGSVSKSLRPFLRKSLKSAEKLRNTRRGSLKNVEIDGKNLEEQESPCHDSKLCQKEPATPLHHPSGQVASFDGGDNFLFFKAPHNSCLTTNITVTFRSDRGDGLLLFSGQKGGVDYWALFLVDGYPVFRFNCGGGPLELVFSKPISSKLWHTLKVSRVKCEQIEIQLNGETRLRLRRVETMGFENVNAGPKFYVGGRNRPIPNAEIDYSDQDKTDLQYSFHGCISYLRVNDVELINANRSAIDLAGNWSKGEPKGLSSCSFDPCSLLKCNSHGVCNVDAGSMRATCRCAAGWKGERCETKDTILVPQFSGQSYIQISIPDDFSEFLHFSAQIRTITPNGIIFHAQNHEKSAYQSIYLNDSRIIFQFDLGTGSGVIKSNTIVKPMTWYHVEAWRSGRGGLLKVDDEEWMEGVAPAGYTNFVGAGRVWVGGLGGNEGGVMDDIRNVGSFIGCVKEVGLNEQPIDLVQSAIASQNVQQCSNDPCQLMTCNNGGRCEAANVDRSKQNVESAKQNVGIVAQNVENAVHNVAHCLCPFPYRGKHCEKRSNSTLETFGFRPGGFVSTKKSAVLKELNSQDFSFSISFLPRVFSSAANPAQPQTLFHVDNSETKLSENSAELWLTSVNVDTNEPGDYLILPKRGNSSLDNHSEKISQSESLQMLEIVYRNGENLLSLLFQSRISGQWHTVHIWRRNDEISLRMDGEYPIMTSASFQSFNYTSLYIGGKPSGSSRVDGGTTFNGCISEVLIGADVRIAGISDLIDEAVNVVDCKQL